MEHPRPAYAHPHRRGRDAGLVFFELKGTPYFNRFSLDTAETIAQANHLLQTGDHPEPVFYRSPLYTYVVAAILYCGGGSWGWLYFFNFALGIGTTVIVAALSRRLLRYPDWLWGPLLYCGCAPVLHYEGILIEVTLLTFLTALSVMLLTEAWRVKRGTALPFAGWVLTLSALIRPVLLPLIYLVPLLAWRHRSLRKGGIILIGVSTITLMPTILHNFAGGEAVLISTSTGANFYIGNNPAATGRYTIPPELAGAGNSAAQQQLFTEVATKRRGQPLNNGAVSDYWLRQGLLYLYKQPVDAAKLYAWKIRDLLNRYEIPSVRNYYFSRSRFRSLQLLPLNFGWLLPGVIVGFWFLTRRRRDPLTNNPVPIWPLVTVMILFSVSLVGFFVLGRYRAPLFPLLAVIAAVGYSGLIHHVRQRAWRQLAIPVVLLCVSGTVTCLPTAEEPLSIEGFRLAVRYQEQGDLSSAEHLYREALQHQPDHLNTINNLALLLTSQGKQMEAKQFWQRLEQEGIHQQSPLHVERAQRYLGRRP